MEDGTTPGEDDKHGADWYRTLVEEVNDLATVVDIDGMITYVSPAVTRILGYEPDELIGHEKNEFVDPDYQERNAEAVETVLSNPSEPQTVEVRFQHADGSWHWIVDRGNATYVAPKDLARGTDVDRRRRFDGFPVRYDIPLSAPQVTRE